eukprot:scaffold2910_cov390-Prasinococcus_capsulatus_cf.AAC.16
MAQQLPSWAQLLAQEHSLLPSFSSLNLLLFLAESISALAASGSRSHYSSVARSLGDARYLSLPAYGWGQQVALANSILGGLGRIGAGPCPGTGLCPGLGPGLGLGLGLTVAIAALVATKRVVSTWLEWWRLPRRRRCPSFVAAVRLIRLAKAVPHRQRSVSVDELRHSVPVPAAVGAGTRRKCRKAAPQALAAAHLAAAFAETPLAEARRSRRPCAPP